MIVHSVKSAGRGYELSKGEEEGSAVAELQSITNPRTASMMIKIVADNSKERESIGLAGKWVRESASWRKHNTAETWLPVFTEESKKKLWVSSDLLSALVWLHPHVCECPSQVCYDCKRQLVGCVASPTSTLQDQNHDLVVSMHCFKCVLVHEYMGRLRSLCLSVMLTCVCCVQEEYREVVQDMHEEATRVLGEATATLYDGGQNMSTLLAAQEVNEWGDTLAQVAECAARRQWTLPHLTGEHCRVIAVSVFSVWHPLCRLSVRSLCILDSMLNTDCMQAIHNSN